MKLTETELNMIFKDWEKNNLPQELIGKEIEIDRRAGQDYRRGKIINLTKEADCISITVEMNKPMNGKRKNRFQILEKSQTRNWHFKCNSCNLRFLTKK